MDGVWAWVFETGRFGGVQYGVLNVVAMVALPVLLLVWWALRVRGRTWLRQCEVLGVAAGAGRALWWRPLGILLPALLTVVALLRPYWGSRETELTVPGNDYMFVVDVSRSMYTRDVAPSRLMLARRKVADLVTELLKTGAAHRFGITLFAGSSFLFCPLTNDITVLRQFVSSIDPEMVSSLGSNLEAGVRTALERLEKSTVAAGSIVLVSDGEDDALAVDKVLELIKTRGVPVHVLGVGTSEGQPIEVESGRFIQDRGGRIVHSKLHEDSLKQIAAASGGIYVRATLQDSDVAALVRALSPGLLGDTTSSQIGTHTRKITTYGEFGPWLALGALVIIVIFALRRGSALLSLLLTVTALASYSTRGHAQGPGVPTPSPSAATTIAPSIRARQAYELYQAGRFREASAAYEAALRTNPDDRDVKQGLASALYKAGNVREAQKLFAELARSAQDGRSYFENQYNNGNALLTLGQYQDAVDAYTQALEVKPDDRRAVENRAVAATARAIQLTITPTPTPTPPPGTPPPATPPPQTPNPEQTSAPSPSAAPQQSPEATQSPDPNSSPEPQPSPAGEGTPPAQPSVQPSAQPNQTAAAEQTTSPVGSPPPSSTQAAEQTGAAEGSPLPTPADATPAAEPSKESAQSAEEQERLKESEDAAPAAAATAAPAAAPTPDTRSLSLREAENWLDSLPETPLLVRRQRGQRNQGGQTW